MVAGDIVRRLETLPFGNSVSSSKDMRGESRRYGESSRSSGLISAAFEVFLALACVTSRLLLGVSLTL